jgi:hypothetical protein
MEDSVHSRSCVLHEDKILGPGPDEEGRSGPGLMEALWKASIEEVYWLPLQFLTPAMLHVEDFSGTGAEAAMV